MKGHEAYMKLALNEAQRAAAAGEVPVGALVVMQDRIIAKGYNQTELLKDVTAHAEMLALTAAFNHLGSKYLQGATLYITLEPCLMCAGAIFWSQVSEVIIGAPDPQRGYSHICRHQPFHPKTRVQQGILEAECGQLLKDFFQKKRH